MLIHPRSAFNVYKSPQAPVRALPLSSDDKPVPSSVQTQQPTFLPPRPIMLRPVMLMPVLVLVPISNRPPQLSCKDKPSVPDPKTEKDFASFTRPPDVWENPTPLRQLLAPDLATVNFQQGSIDNCYLLSGLDSIIHHPKGEKLLNQITVEECLSPSGWVLKYKLTFPSGRWGAFYADELGMRKCGRSPLTGPEAIRMIELAHAKMTRKKRNKERINPFSDEGRGFTPVIAGCGSPKKALFDLFPGESVEFAPMQSFGLRPQFTLTEPLSQDPESLRNLKTKLKHIAADNKHDYFLSAVTPRLVPSSRTISIQRQHPTPRRIDFCRFHSYSIRSFDLTKKTITVANPHNTRDDVQTLTFQEFCNVFLFISGIRVPADGPLPKRTT